MRSLRLELRHEGVLCAVMHAPLTNTRSTHGLGYSEPLLIDPTDVGGDLAGKGESTAGVIFADWKTKFGIALSRRSPSLVSKGIARFVSWPE